jgi:uncharacterized membrane protein YedE/YeeE
MPAGLRPGTSGEAGRSGRSSLISGRTFMTNLSSTTGRDTNAAGSGGLRNNAVFKDLFVNPWTYVTGAVILALLNIALIASTGKGWGVTTAFAYWAGWIWNGVGGDAHNWAYFTEVAKGFNGEGFNFLNDPASIMNLGIIAGAFLSVLLASQARFKGLKSGKQAVAAILGGLLMGFGARLAFGCNIGALFTALPSLSGQGWVFIVFIFLGAAVGSRLLVKYFI